MIHGPYRMTGRYTVACVECGRNTTTKHARGHEGLCKACVTGYIEELAGPKTDYTKNGERIASREVQYARYLDCGPAAWDDR